MPVTCLDGTTADTFAECPQTIDYEEDRGWTPDPTGETGDFITGTGEDSDSALRDIFEALGGASWFGSEEGTYADTAEGNEAAFQEWKNMYGEDFPEWTGSTYEKKSDIIQSKMGILSETLDLTKKAADIKSESLRFTTGQDLENLQGSREAIMRAGGGLQSGQREKKIDSAYDRILKGYNYTADAAEISLSQSLLDIEGRQMSYETDLLDIVQNYQDNMWDLISSASEMQGGGGTGDIVTPTIDSCGRGPDAPDYMNPDCGTRVTDENQEFIDPEYDGLDEQDHGQGQWNNPQDQNEGFGEDRDIDDYWEDDVGIS